MKIVKNYFQILCALLAMGVILSCGDDDDDNDCGFSAVIESNENFEAAVEAYSTDPSDANCQALESAITDFESKAQGLDVECLNENDAANFISWGISVATTDC